MSKTSFASACSLWFLALLVLSSLLQSGWSQPADLHRVERAIDNNESSTNEPEVIKTCHSSTPCGWLIYAPFTRQITFFMRNSCVCSKGRSCTRQEDDVSVSAYVYRCTTIKENPNKPSD